MKVQPLSLYKHILSIYLNLLEGRRMSNTIKTRTSEKAIEKSHLNQTVTPPPPHNLPPLSSPSFPRFHP